MNIELLPVAAAPSDIEDLIGVLTECVAGGASIGFLAPLARDEAEAFWRKVLGELGRGSRVVLVAREPGFPATTLGRALSTSSGRAASTGSGQAGRIVGTAQIVFETKANGRHRAEVQKVLVRPSHRRQGIAARLMVEVETLAVRRGVWLLHLDTSDSHAGARQLYEALGYNYVGGIPFFATDTHGTPEQNAIFYKVLARPA